MGASPFVRLVLAAAAIAAAACTSAPVVEEQSPGAATVDSIVLERGPCFGFCPMYRLVIDGTGRIRYQNRGADAVQRDSIAPDAVAHLFARANEAGFFALPDRIREDSTLCSMVATDHPSVTVSFFSPTSAKTVDHYTGCHVGRESPGPAPAIVRLMALEAEIDSTADVARWRAAPGPR